MTTFIHEKRKLWKQGFSGHTCWIWAKMRADLMKQLTVPQETLSNGVRVVVVRRTVLCLFGETR